MYYGIIVVGQGREQKTHDKKDLTYLRKLLDTIKNLCYNIVTVKERSKKKDFKNKLEKT